MGWQVSIKEKKNEEPKYKIWSTISDSYITEWLTKKELIQFMFWYKLEDFMNDFLKSIVSFPDRWTNHDTDKRFELPENRAIINKILNDSVDNNNVIPYKFIEILKEGGIEISIKDSQGYNISNNE